jgi:hypothetical protein
MADVHPELAAARARAAEAGAAWEAHPSAATGRENAEAATALVLAEVQYNPEVPWAEPEPGPEVPGPDLEEPWAEPEAEID